VSFTKPKPIRIDAAVRHMATIQNVHDYWNARPCNVRHSTKSQDTVEFYDEVAAKKYKVEDHKLEFLALEKWRGKHVLELGCGLGTDAIQFAKAGAHVTCVDLTENSLALCKRNFELHGLEGEFFLGNIEDLSSILPAGYEHKYDLIYSFGVIHHTPNPKKVFEQMPKFLTSDGEVRVMLYSRFSYKLFWLMNSYNQWTFENVDELVQNYSEAQSGCPVTYTYTFDEVRELLAPHLHVESIWKDHVFMWQIEPYKRNEFIREPTFQNVSDDYLKQLRKDLGWHTMCVAKLPGSAAQTHV
jgi:2-polyprenyl-3-methyl-5-hydroxy-6-metoxy-1,4-benzoquinol methylase